MSTTQDTGGPRLEREHTQLARQLRRAHQDLDYFVRALSHDMSANFMLLESSFGRLKKAMPDTPPEVLTEMVTHVEACIGQSRQFLNDLVHLARTGSVEMEPERVELAAVVDEVLFEQDELLRGRGIRVEVRRPLPAAWYNRQRLKQIVTNVVRNAIKHGCDAQNARIEIEAIREGGSPDEEDVYPTVRLRIHDNGPGIDPRFADDVFLPGRRLAGADDEGSGMGLAIVRKIAEHYGGAARVDFGRLPGMTIEITLPGGFVVPASRPWIKHRGESHAPMPATSRPRRPHIRHQAGHRAH